VKKVKGREKDGVEMKAENRNPESDLPSKFTSVKI